MRRNAGRLFTGAALLAGFALLGPLGAADLSDDEFKGLVEQDAKTIAKAVAAVEKAKDKKTTEQRAAGGVKSAAMLVATYANARIGGKNADADAQAASVRDAALHVMKAAGTKDFKAVADAAKEMGEAKPAAEAKKIDLAKEFAEATVDDSMHAFKKTAQFGNGGEDEIKANAKKATMKPDAVVALANRVLALAELSKMITKGENEAKKKEWAGYNARMEKAAEELLKAAKAKKTGPELAKAFTAVNAACTTCHSAFKGE